MRKQYVFCALLISAIVAGDTVAQTKKRPINPAQPGATRSRMPSDPKDPGATSDNAKGDLRLIVTVRDSAGKPIQGAKLTLTGGKDPIEVISRSDGTAQFGNLVQGEYGLSASHDSFTTTTQKITMKRDVPALTQDVVISSANAPAKN